MHIFKRAIRRILKEDKKNKELALKKRIDIMTDIETLGNGKNVCIIQLAAIAFDIKTGKYIDTFNYLVDISETKNLSIDGDTLKWWLKTDKDLLSKIILSGKKPISEVLILFNDWIKCLPCEDKSKYLWGNGILFDNRIIQEEMLKYQLEYPIFYHNDRDVRTILELASLKEGISEEEFKKKHENKNLVKHNALDDVKYQINIVVECFNLLTKKQQSQ